MLLLTGALVIGCSAIGQAILALCGVPGWRWWAPALGYAALISLGAQVLRIPNHEKALVVVMALALAAALAVPRVRRAVVAAAPEGVPLALGLILVAAIPFFATGRTGVLGATVSNDMSQHLTAAFYLRTGEGLRPAAAFGGNLITTGYPLGPHGLTALLTTATGLDEERTFAAITLAVPVLTGLAALGIVPSAPRVARWALGAVVGLGYLLAAYLAQGAFKELIEAMLVLASVLALGDLLREESRPPRWGWRCGVPIGLLGAGAVYDYSYGGLTWIAGIAGVLLVVEAARRPRAVLSILRRATPPALAAVAVAAIVLAPEITRIEAFGKSIFGVEPTTQHGNLFRAVSPLETIGLWFSGDFRFNPAPEWPTLVFSWIGVAALIGSAAWWWRRRAFALPAALIASIAIWVELALTRNTYNAAKGLVVMAPIAMACIGAPLAAAWGTRSRVARARRLLTGGRVVGVLLLGGAIVATFAALRSTPVGLGSHEQELAVIRPLVRGKSVLFINSDHFAQWELRGARMYVTSVLYAPEGFPAHKEKPQGPPGDAVDVDNFDSSDLDKLDFILTPGAAYRSEIPPNFRLTVRTPSYLLYRRKGATPYREPFEPVDQPGALFDCNRSAAGYFLGRYRWAGVLPAPVVSTAWHGSAGVPGHTATVRVNLPPGRWDVSLQYLSPTSVMVRAPRLHRVIAPNYGLIKAYWPAGTLISDGRPFTLSLQAENRSWFGRLLGSPRSLITPDSPHMAPLWHVAFTRHGATPQRVPVHQACGRYVDWFAPAGSAMH
jgi:hypothetical protein